MNLKDLSKDELKAKLMGWYEEAKADMRRDGVDQADALLLAGWSFELPEIADGWKHGSTEAWQWRWRRPARRKNSKGRLFRSTGQAYRELMKDRK